MVEIENLQGQYSLLWSWYSLVNHTQYFLTSKSVFSSKSHALLSPGCIEFNEPQILALENQLIKVTVRQLYHVFLTSSTPSP